MRRDTLNFLVDALALVAFLGLLATGLILWTLLPPGSRGGHGLSLWGLTRHDFGDIHFWIAVALVVLLILHVALHWTWVCVTVQRWLRPAGAKVQVASARTRNLCGVAFFVALCIATGGFYLAARNGVVHDDGDGRGRGGERRAAVQSGLFLTGSMTLGEAAAVVGVDASTLRDAIGLPATVSPDERIGRLRKRFGLDLEVVRRTAADLAEAGPTRDRAADP